MLIDSGYFYNPIKRDIAMIQGDTCSFGFQLQGLGGQRPSSIYLSCKEKVEDEEALFRVSLNNNIDERSYDSDRDILTYGVRIPPQATRNIPLGRYFYDLQVVVNGDIITLMVGRLSLEYQVTRDYAPEPPPIEDGDFVVYPTTITHPTLQKRYTEDYVNNIAQGINSVSGASDNFTISQMANAIESLIWEGTQEEYDALTNINPTTLYIIIEED